LCSLKWKRNGRYEAKKEEVNGRKGRKKEEEERN
jgi:hypothetical protein